MQEPENLKKVQSDIDQVRSKRIGQFVIVLIATISALTLVNLLVSQTVAVGTLLISLTTLVISLFFLRRGQTQFAACLALIVMFFGISEAMWDGHGLRSSALLAFPGAMLFAMIMIGKRAFYLSYGTMVLYMALLVTANVQGWRTGEESMTGYRWLIDYTILLSCVAFVIRVLASDLLTLLEGKHQQIHEATQSKIAAEHLANHDNLTGLPNRRMAELYFEDMLRQSRQDGSGMGLIFVDVDNFKTVNDSHGHQCGDDLLKHIGQTIAAQLRKTDKLARIAGDEFLILLPNISNSDDVESILAKINSAVHGPVIFDGETLSPALSMGIALAPQHGSDFRELLKKADKALYQAKAAGRNRYQFFQQAP